MRPRTTLHSSLRVSGHSSTACYELCGLTWYTIDIKEGMDWRSHRVRRQVMLQHFLIPYPQFTRLLFRCRIYVAFTFMQAVVRV